jgi:hypothetical protein
MKRRERREMSHLNYVRYPTLTHYRKIPRYKSKNAQRCCGLLSTKLDERRKEKNSDVQL